MLYTGAQPLIAVGLWDSSLNVTSQDPTYP
jgi:hypothetical protein